MKKADQWIEDMTNDSGWDWSFAVIMHKRHWNSKVSPRVLGRALKRVRIDKDDVYPFSFCPKCGCTETVYTNGGAEYPEMLAYHHCSKCEWLVAMIDNSPLIHCFEYADNDYEIDF